MRPRRLLLLGLGVTALLVLAGIASNDRPLRGGGRGSGPSATFFDYVYTTGALAGIATFLVLLYVFLVLRYERVRARPDSWRIWSTLLAMALALAIGLVYLRSDLGARLRQALAGRAQPGEVKPGKHGGSFGRNARVRWDEVALVLVLVAGTAAVLIVTRPRRRMPRLRPLSQEAVALALDESLDDLRDEPDLRRAIIAAYARMERALAANGIARHPAEAPFEFIARALCELDASADAAETLTVLFEWAKFSQHEPEPYMRDEAIAALVAVRDELRGPRERAAA